MRRLFFGVQRWIAQPQRFSAWCGSPTKVGSFRGLQKFATCVGSILANIHRSNKITIQSAFFLAVRGGKRTRCSAAETGSAIRRRRLLLRHAVTCNLRRKPLSKYPPLPTILSIAQPQRFSAWFGNPPQAVAFAACINNR